MLPAKQIGPGDLLEIGTKVTVKSKHGNVVAAKFVKDQFGQPICLHTIKFHKILTDRYRMLYKKIDTTETVNYAHINVNVVI
jgi:hypothetical protein